MSGIDPAKLSCPIPISDYPHVLLAHGGGGRLMRNLIERMFRAAFGDDALNQRHDAAVLEAGGDRIAFTTDSYVVRPIFFPGGDIGSLAVHGTVNDLAMGGARPLYLSAGFILEEGLPMQDLWRVVRSMADAARACGVRIVAGDTKVVERGKGDGVYVNTAGVGVVENDLLIRPSSVTRGDALILSGDVGRHGIAVMAVREGLEFETTIESDSASVAAVALGLFETGIEVHCLRDLTRGGLASALNEIAADSGTEIVVYEAEVPVMAEVRGACEILGLDPLYVANEGRFVAIVPERDASRAVEAMRAHDVAAGARVVGSVRDGDGVVTLRNALGAERILDLLGGEQLPRIC